MIDILTGDCRAQIRMLADQSVNCIVTSPPYFGLRDYDVEGQIGLEPTPDEFVAAMVEVFREAHRVLRDDGTLWLNLGDSYNNFRVSTNGQSLHKGETRGKFTGRRPVDGNLKEKDLIGIPWRVAFALQADGWYLRQDIIWHKPNPMPESVKDRCTKAHEYIFMFSKSPKYYFDIEAMTEPSIKGAAGSSFSKGKTAKHQLDRSSSKERVDVGTRNKRSVWTVTTKPFKEAHFATFPPDLIEPCVLAGCPVDGVVLDPFFGAGTTGLVAQKHGRRAVGIELNPDYVRIAKLRLGILMTDDELYD